MNVYSLERRFVGRAEAVDNAAGNRLGVGHTDESNAKPDPGVQDDGEFAKRCTGTWEAHVALREEYSRHKRSTTQGLENGIMGGGVSRSSDDASNDRGAKGWQM